MNSVVCVKVVPQLNKGLDLTMYLSACSAANEVTELNQPCIVESKPIMLLIQIKFIESLS